MLLILPPLYCMAKLNKIRKIKSLDQLQALIKLNTFPLIVLCCGAVDKIQMFYQIETHTQYKYKVQTPPPYVKGSRYHITALSLSRSCFNNEAGLILGWHHVAHMAVGCVDIV